MSDLAQSLWSPSGKDAISQDMAPESWLIRVSNSQPATSVSVTVDLETLLGRDKMIHLRHAVGVVDPGAAQNANFATMGIGIIGAQMVLDQQQLAAGNTDLLKCTWQGDIPLLWNHIVLLNGQFNAGAANNLVVLSLAGVVQPRGNWRRAQL